MIERLISNRRSPVASARLTALLLAASCFALRVQAQLDEAMKYVPADADQLSVLDLTNLSGSIAGLVTSTLNADNSPATAFLGIAPDDIKLNVSASSGALDLFTEANLAELANSVDALTKDLMSATVSVQTFDPIDEEAIAEKLEAFDSREIGGQTVYSTDGHSSTVASLLGSDGAFFLPSDDMLVVGPIDQLETLISNPSAGGLEDFDFIDTSFPVFFGLRFENGAPLDSSAFDAEMPEFLEYVVSELAPNLEGFSFGLRSGGQGTGVAIQLGMADGTDKARAEREIESALSQLSDLTADALANNDDVPPAFGFLIPMVTGIVDGLTPSLSGDVITVETEIPEALMATIQSFAQASAGEAGGAIGFGGAAPTGELPNQLTLNNGRVIRGEINRQTIDENGIVVQLTSGGFSRRYHWSELDQPTLKSLRSAARTATEPLSRADLYILKERNPRPQFQLSNPSTRVARVEDAPNLLAAIFQTPIGWMFLGLIYISSLYAGREVARFKGHHPALVMGCSAVIPLFSPLVFLFIPPESDAPAEEEWDDEVYEEEDAGEPVVAETPAPSRVGEPEGSAAGLSLTSSVEAESSAQGIHLHHKEVEFSRNLIEKELSSFFRIVPTTGDRDLVLEIKTAKTTFVASRISRISATDMHVRLVSNSSQEIPIKIKELVEIRARHKKDK